ncbi:unnamed protein product [Eruca vesicaria subsp. sativa]|uniref:F-box domain-containing protein n=1 Tax=Eruca vesicaria subsp. sativa TaxID=29727 RepID=A0ABC8JRW9_ERUVS|nr:unnamed protein product [Eruca vesicaria subsp. sativa]
MASSSLLSSSLPPEAEVHRNWADLPPELTSLILQRLSTIEMVEKAEKVCSAARGAASVKTPRCGVKLRCVP